MIKQNNRGRRMMNEAVREALLIAGQMGFDLEDIRIIFPTLRDISDEAIDKCLQHGQVLHRLNISAKLYGIIEAPDTEPKALIAAERHLREVHTKTSPQAGSMSLLNLLRGTVPMVPNGNEEEEGGDDENEE
jgi:hypothetical protein